MSVKVYIGKQSAIDTIATDFLLLRTTDPGLSYGLTVINSTALTGKEWGIGGLTTTGEMSGTIGVEMSRPLIELLGDSTGFVTTKTTDTVMKTEDIATYNYVTIVQEFTDQKGNKYHDIYKNCIISNISLAIEVDAYLIGTITPLSTSKPETKDGEFTVTTPITDDEKSLFCEESKIKFGTSDKECEFNSVTWVIDNNLSTSKVICGDYNLQKGGLRTITIDASQDTLDSQEYQGEFAKAIAGDEIKVDIVLKNKDGDEVDITMPKMVYTTVTPGDLGTNGSMSSSLNALWDDGTSTSCSITIKAKNNVLPTGITVNSAQDNVDAGSDLQMTVDITPPNATDKTVAWSVDNATKGTIGSTSGLLHGEATGSVEVTATSNADNSVIGKKTITIN